MSAAAMSHGPSTTGVQRLRPPGLVQSPVFSHVAVVPPSATTVLVGGQNAVDATGALVGGDDVAAQTEQTLANLATALSAAGARPSDIVQWRIQAVEGADAGAAVEVFMRWWDPDVAPPLITVSVVRGLAVPGALVEIDAVAAIAA